MKKYISIVIALFLFSCKSEYQEKLEQMTVESKQFHTKFASKNRFEIDILELNGVRYDTLNINDLDSMRFYILFDKFQFYKMQIETSNQLLQKQSEEIQSRKAKGATEASQATAIEEFNRIKRLTDACIDSLKTIKTEQDVLVQKIEQNTTPDRVYRMKYYMRATVNMIMGLLNVSWIRWISILTKIIN